MEFRRAVDGFPSYADVIDRWREISSQKDSHISIDMKTFDGGRSDSARLWIKQSHDSNDAGGPYSVEQYELNCGAREIRTVSFANYDASGNVIGSREGGNQGASCPTRWARPCSTACVAASDRIAAFRASMGLLSKALVLAARHAVRHAGGTRYEAPPCG